MSRGLSNLQRGIIDVLAGGPLTTGEILTDLQARGFLIETPRRQALCTIGRACRSLRRRGKVQGRFGTMMMEWRLTPTRK